MAATVAKSYFNADIPEIVVKSLFKKYDTDGSGRLGKNEMSSMLKDDYEAVFISKILFTVQIQLCLIVIQLCRFVFQL